KDDDGPAGYSSDARHHGEARRYGCPARRSSSEIGARPPLTVRLRTKVLLAFLAVSLCPLSLIAYRHSEVTRSALTRAAHQSLFAAASQTALRLDTFMAATANVVGTEAKMPALAEYLSRPAGVRAQAKADEVVDMLQAFAEKNSVFTSSVAVLDLHGRIVLDTQPSNIGLNES